jgi:hypothetical protein
MVKINNIGQKEVPIYKLLGKNKMLITNTVSIDYHTVADNGLLFLEKCRKLITKQNK